MATSKARKDTEERDLLCPRLMERIRAKPLIPAETFEIFQGCKDAERNFDITTGQTISNGVVLCYTPKEAVLTPKKSRKRQLLEEEKVTHHEGLGVLDILPVSPQVIFTHGSARDIFEKSFTYFVRGLARTRATLAFRMD
jgi:hypothetical protein